MNKHYEIPLDLPTLGLTDFIAAAKQHQSKIKFRTEKFAEWGFYQNVYEIRGMFKIKQFNLVSVPGIQAVTVHPDSKLIQHNNFFIHRADAHELYKLMAHLYAENQARSHKTK